MATILGPKQPAPQSLEHFHGFFWGSGKCSDCDLQNLKIDSKKKSNIYVVATSPAKQSFHTERVIKVFIFCSTNSSFSINAFCCFLLSFYLYLEPQTTIYKWMFQLDDSKSLHRKWLFHQTSIQVFKLFLPKPVPGSAFQFRHSCRRTDRRYFGRSDRSISIRPLIVFAANAWTYLFFFAVLFLFPFPYSKCSFPILSQIWSQHWTISKMPCS